MSENRYHVRVHFEDDTYWAEIAELPGCFAVGDTMDELINMLPEVVGDYLSRPRKRPVRVEVADVQTEREADQEKELLVTTH